MVLIWYPPDLFLSHFLWTVVSELPVSCLSNTAFGHIVGRNLPARECTVLYCTTLYGTELYYTVLRNIILHITLPHCTVLYCTTLYCTELYYNVLRNIILHITLPHCTALNCGFRVGRICEASQWEVTWQLLVVGITQGSEQFDHCSVYRLICK